mgnify:CR=1 FL=1
MQKKESRLEFFKNAIISTVKSISKKKDCEIKFGKSTNQTNNEKFINLPEINKLENINDFLLFRAKADSEALRLKYSNKIFLNFTNRRVKCLKNFIKLPKK